MPDLDPALSAAIDAVVAEHGQPAAVGQRLKAWLTEISRGELGKDDDTQFFASVREAIVLKDQSHAD